MSIAMTVLAALGFLYCVAAFVRCFVAGWRGSAPVRRMLLASRTRIVDLDDGRLVDLRGSITLTGEGIVSPSGKVCAAAQVTVRSGATKPERGTPHTISRGAPKVLLTDATGSVMLDLENVEIVAPAYEESMSSSRLAAEWRNHVPENVAHLNLHVTESVLEDGAQVRVRGRVERLADDVELAPDGGYRDGAPKLEARHRIIGSAADRLLVTQGGTAKVFLRTGAPALALFVIGAAFLMHAGILVYLLLA
jgi:hypothetical protein